MPEEAYWESLFDAGAAVDAFVQSDLSTTGDVGEKRILELGCGYGTFTVELAKQICGYVDSIDLELEMVERTKKRLSDCGIKNASVYQGDFVTQILPADLRDYDIAVLFHIMHLENPDDVLRRVSSRVRPGGRVAFLHWRSDQETPRGPDMSIRPNLADYQSWAAASKLEPPREILLPHCPHHYAVECRKPI